jgi:hypothetical protein
MPELQFLLRKGHNGIDRNSGIKYNMRKEKRDLMSGKLERKYGLFTAICMVVGIVIGSGVFFKAQTILQKTGGDMPLGFLA